MKKVSVLLLMTVISFSASSRCAMRGPGEHIRELIESEKSEEEKKNILEHWFRKDSESIEWVDFYGWTPLACAVGKGLTDLASYLLSKNANIEASSLKNDKTPLIMAAETGSLGMVKLLLEHKASVSATSESLGYSAILLAADREDEDSEAIVAYLLSQGACIPDVYTDFVQEWYPRGIERLRALQVAKHSDALQGIEYLAIAEASAEALEEKE